MILDLENKYLLNNSTILGKGSFSLVYEGTFKNSDKKVAIKKITRLGMNLKMKERLSEEIIIMNKIKEKPHPNIVKCYDIFDYEEYVLIIMEFCESGDLGSIIKEPIREVWVQFFMCQLVNGLKYLDKNNILHRDLKPKNILLTNESKVLKIADFGLARILQKKTLINTLCGSPLYMAPEILDRKAYTTRTDLWSIGILIYEMLFGKHPLANCQDFDQLVITIKNNDIQIPPKNNINKISKPCIELVKKMITKNPNKRITWNEFFNHPWLNRFKFKNLQDEPVRINSSESLVSLTKNLNTYDNELEHSQYNINHFRENSKHINIIPDYIPIKIGLGIDNDEDNN